MPIPILKSRLKNLMYRDLTHSWSLCSFAKITHMIHPDWLSKASSVYAFSFFACIYNCLAVNRAPFRSWLHKIKRAESKQCRYGCQCDETPPHVLFDCPFVEPEHLKIKRNVVMEILNLTYKINDSHFFTNAGRTLAFIILSVL
eukprot:UN01179